MLRIYTYVSNATPVKGPQVWQILWFGLIVKINAPSFPSSFLVSTYFL